MMQLKEELKVEAEELENAVKRSTRRQKRRRFEHKVRDKALSAERKVVAGALKLPLKLEEKAKHLAHKEKKALAELAKTKQNKHLIHEKMREKGRAVKLKVENQEKKADAAKHAEKKLADDLKKKMKKEAILKAEVKSLKNKEVLFALLFLFSRMCVKVDSRHEYVCIYVCVCG